MTVSVLASGQIGSDGTGSPISGSIDPGASPKFVMIFVVENGNLGGTEVTSATYGGVSGSVIFGGYDGDIGQVNCWYIGTSGSIPTGSQTVSVSFSGASGATRRVYCVVFGTDSGSLEYYDNGNNGGNTSNPTDSKNPSVGEFVSGGACLFYGGAATAVSVANGAQLVESDFSGGTRCGSLIWANATVENATITMGWTAVSADVAASYIYIQEIAAPLTVMDVTDPASVMGVSGYASVMGVEP